MAGELRAAIRTYRSALTGVGLATGLINLLSLAGPLFMLQIYDRVLPSRSVPTLVGLALLVLVLFAFQGLLDMLRGRILLRIGRGLDEKLSPRVFELVTRAPLMAARPAGEGLQSIRDLDNVRTFMSGTGLTAFFDLPWMPLYIAVCFLFHPAMGLTVVLGALVICSSPSSPMQSPADRAGRRSRSRRRAISLPEPRAAHRRAAGRPMRRRMTAQWLQANEAYLESQAGRERHRGGAGQPLARAARALQSGVLGVGAWLVINQEATAGVMLAATILCARAARAPRDRQLEGFRRRAAKLGANARAEEGGWRLPPPGAQSAARAVTMVPPGAALPRCTT
jgi:ATP-binding cassette subfamily C protein